MQKAVKYAPSAFNSQGARAVLLFGKAHQTLWDITEETLRALVAPEKFGATQDKLAAFAAGYGTILFFEDTSVVEALQKQFPLYADNFPLWSIQSNGMLQYIVWAGLESRGLGASLQHYNPLIDEKVKQQWNLPPSWRLFSQMPFGNRVAEPEEKTFLPVEDRMLVFES